MNKFSKALHKQAEEAKRKEENAKTPLREEPRTHSESVPSSSSMKKETRIVPNAQVDKCIVSLHDSRSTIAEQYRTLRTNIKTINKGKVKTILISSSQEAEGKTVTAINLAYSFAHDTSKKVLLVDADLRRSKVADYLGINKDIPGFTQILEGTIAFEDCVLTTELPNLHVVIGHNDGGAHNASELLESKNMQKCLDEWKRAYDYIILDSPPILPVTDAAVLGTQVDGVLMVFKAGKTQKKIIKHAQHMFEQAGVTLLGYVMTHIQHLSPGSRDYYYSYYRY